MKVPFVDLKTQYASIKSEVRAAMDEVLDNTAYILGKPVANFENAFAEIHNVKFCSGVSSGTDGNHLVLWALGVGPGDEVIIPGDTFIATAWGATLCGATPVFVDVAPESYNLDAKKVAAAITPRTKAIVAVHLYGQATDLDEIIYQLSIINFELVNEDFTTENTESTEKNKEQKKLSRENHETHEKELKENGPQITQIERAIPEGIKTDYKKQELSLGKEKSNDQLLINNDQLKDKIKERTKKPGVFRHKTTGQVIYLVEDCAQSHLAEYKGKKVGGLAVAASFSFYPGKNLGAYGEGGAVCTNDEELGKKFRMMREHGSHEKYLHLIYGHNYRMEGLQGAVLGVKLNHLEKWTAGRRQAAEWYKKYLGDCDSIVLPKEMEENKHVYHLYVVKVNYQLSINNDQLEDNDQLSISNEQLKDKDKEKKKGRDGLMRFLSERGVASGLHYPVPLHLQPCFEHLGYKRGDLPVTEDLADSCLSLPMFPELTEEQVAFVCECVKKYFI